MLTVSPLAGSFEPPSAKTDAGGGRDGFAPLIAGLLGPEVEVPDCTLLPPDGENLPGVAPPQPPAVRIATGSPVGAEPPLPPSAEPSPVGRCQLVPPSRFVPRHLFDDGDGVVLPEPGGISASGQTGGSSDDEGDEADPASILGSSLPDIAPSPLPLIVGAPTPALAAVTVARLSDPPSSLVAGALSPGASVQREEPGAAALGQAEAISPAPAVVSAATVAVAAMPLRAAREPSDEEPRDTRTGLPPTATAPVVAISPFTPPIILPALQAFGAAMRQALADERASARPPSATEPSLIGGLAASAALTAAPVALDSAMLDTADRRWPHAMAEQIEKLRDAANEQSTRIRLLPDALGPVDVSVRRDGEQVHVHFTAAQADTRQLLAEAQPRLVDAAEARGLKLGRTDVSGGDLTGDRQQQRPAPSAPLPSRPAPARVSAEAAGDTDHRLA